MARVLFYELGEANVVRAQPAEAIQDTGFTGIGVLLFCDSMDCSLPGSSVHEISQIRILEWVAISFSKGFSRPRDQTPVPTCISSYYE